MFSLYIYSTMDPHPDLRNNSPHTARTLEAPSVFINTNKDIWTIPEQPFWSQGGGWLSSKVQGTPQLQVWTRAQMINISQVYEAQRQLE